MSQDETQRTAYFTREEMQFAYDDPVRQRRKDDRVARRTGYIVELSGEPIPLELIEFRILMFLAATPYRAYTRKQIVRAVADSDCPLDEATVDRHVMSLRDKLGLFSDYVQSVPYVGYRFKA